MTKLESKGVQIITATERDENQRLDNCLFRLFKTLPKSRLYRLMRKGELRVNKKRVDPEYRVQVGDQIRIPPLHLEVAEKEPQAQNLKSWQKEWLNDAVLLETDDFMVINKPCGLSVHAGSGTHMGVIEILRQARSELKFIELAHRLDRETSGCLLIAKKPAALKQFHQMLRERESIQKTYRVVVKGAWPKRLNRVDLPVEGKSSLTTFQVLQAYPYMTELSAVLHTGRQHQIRIHCQKSGYPIIGDGKHGDFAFNKDFIKRTGEKRMFLHAARLEFLWKEKKYVVEAPCNFNLN